MRFYGIESIGKLILQKVSGLPTFDGTRDEGRIVYNTNDGKTYTGDSVNSKWTKSLEASNNLSDVDNSSTAVSNIGALEASNDLSDVSSASTSRSNLGLGTAAVEDVGTSSSNVPQNSDLGNSAYRAYTISTSDPSGGSDGDVHYKVS